MMCKVIAVANQKGGTAKTTTTLNLGAELARKGKKVLLIDADGQGDLTAALGYKNADDYDITLATMLRKSMNDEPMNPTDGILHHPEGMDLMPGNIELAGIEVALVNALDRERVLSEYIKTMRPFYDFILIDSMPSLGMITINVLASADSVLIPVQASYLPVKGLQQLIKTIGRVQRQLNPKLTIEGILLTMVDNRTNYAKDIALQVYDAYADNLTVFDCEIPMSVRAAETSAEGSSLYVYDPKGKAAFAYTALIKEVIKKEAV